MTIGENIRKIRKEKGFTQKQLGELCGIDEANIRKYELGKANPKIETIEKIAQALETSSDVIRGLKIVKNITPEQLTQYDFLDPILLNMAKNMLDELNLSEGVDLDSFSPDFKAKLFNVFLEYISIDDSGDKPIINIHPLIPLSPENLEEKILLEFRQLNLLGKEEAIKRVNELTEIDKYTKRYTPTNDTDEAL